MAIKSRREILDDIFQDTDENKIKWDISIEKDSVKAIHAIQLTPKKKLIIKLIYFEKDPKNTRLTVSLQQIEGKSIETKNIIYIGGKNKSSEVKEVSYLLNKILLKEEEEHGKTHDFHIKDQIRIGDKVVVIREQDLGKKVIGQKGKILTDISNGDNLAYVVKFDNHFSKLLIDDGTKYSNCWTFSPDNLKKIG